MRPESESAVNIPATSAVPPAPSPDFEALLQRLAQCSRDEQRTVLNRVLRLLLGDRVEQEYGLYEPDGTPYLYLVPPNVRARLNTPEFLADLDRSSRSTGPVTLFRDLIKRLESMG